MCIAIIASVLMIDSKCVHCLMNDGAIDLRGTNTIKIQPDERLGTLSAYPRQTAAVKCA